MDLIIGIKDTLIHPVVFREKKYRTDSVRLQTLQLGSGYLLDGSHPSINVYGGKLYRASHRYRCQKIATKVSLINHTIVHQNSR